MKRNFCLRSKLPRYLLKLLISLGLGSACATLLILIESLIYKYYRLSPGVLQKLAVFIWCVAVTVSTAIFVRIAKTKGYIGGIVCGILYSILLLICNASTNRVGVNCVINIILLITIGILTGILRANKKKKRKW